MGDIENWELQKKKITPDQAAELVKSGDMVFYGEFVLFPEACDEALSKRVHELENVDIRSVCYTKVPKVVEVDPERNHFILNYFIFGTFSVHLYDNHFCIYVPFPYHRGQRFIGSSL